MSTNVSSKEAKTGGLANLGYSRKAIELFRKRINIGSINEPGICVSTESNCGDTLILSLQIDQGIIRNAKYQYIGCIGLQTAASALTEFIIGIPVEQAYRIRPADIRRYLGRIPSEKNECITFACRSLHLALDKFQAGKKMPSLFPFKIDSS